jgi:hypothetical protein
MRGDTRRNVAEPLRRPTCQRRPAPAQRRGGVLLPVRSPDSGSVRAAEAPVSSTGVVQLRAGAPSGNGDPNVVLHGLDPFGLPRDLLRVLSRLVAFNASPACSWLSTSETP